MTSHRHIKSAIACKKPCLLLNRVISAFHLVLAGADIARTGHATEGKTAACRYAVLLRFVVVAVLLAAHPQVSTNIRDHFIAADLRAIQKGIATTGHRYFATAVQRGLRPRRAVTLLMSFCRIHVGEDADTIAIGSSANADPYTAATAAIFPGCLLSVCRTAQYDIIRCCKRGVPTRLYLAAADQNIAAVPALTFTRRRNSQIVACIQGAACHSITPGMLLRL